MADEGKKDPKIENLEVTELEDEDLEGASGGGIAPVDDVSNSGCPTNVNCPC